MSELSDTDSDDGFNEDMEALKKACQFTSHKLLLSPTTAAGGMPDWSDDDDIENDYETLRAIQRRFAAYGDGRLKDNLGEFLQKKESSNSFVERTNAREGFLNCVDTSEPTGKNVEACHHAGGSSDISNGSAADDVVGLPLQNSHFPNSALAFVDAIKKNRLCQKLIRSKMMQMEARMEELGKLIEGVRVLKDFQTTCKKRTGRALLQKRILVLS